jgi:predicted Zn-dependent peptidase
MSVLVAASVISTLACGSGAHASSVALDKMVQEYHLENGLTLLVVENHEAPTIGVVTSFSVGGAEERPGINGVTHILEHMLFKGTVEVGTSDWDAEKVHYDRIEEITTQIKAEQKKGPKADAAKIEALRAERIAEEAEEKKYAVDNELSGYYEEAGGVGINAFTSYDVTAYLMSLPSNRLELWMYLESERLRRPILRQFYTEVQNVMEERRLRTDGDPEGKLVENLLAVAFDAHWYGYPVIGYPSDISSLTRTETEKWFREYYAPNQMTLVVVGDIDANEVHRLAKEYFGDIPAQTPPEPLETFDLPKEGTRYVEVEYDAEPRLMMGWHKENVPSPDDAALSVLSAVLTGGRSARFEKDLVEQRQLVASIDTDHEFPGNRWANLFLLQAEPRAPHTTAEVEQAIWEGLERLKREPVTERELEKAKNRIRAEDIRSLASNQGLAIKLAYFQAAHRDWRVVLDAADRIEAVTAADVQRVAKETFRRKGTIVAVLVEPSFEPDPEKEARGAEIATQMVTALGGRERLAGIRSVDVHASVAIQTPGGTMTAKSRTEYALPDRLRSEFSVFGQTMIRGMGPDGPWQVAGGAASQLEGDDAKEARGSLERDMFLLAFPIVREDYVLQAQPDQDGLRVLEARGPTGRAFTTFVDTKTGLPVRVEYESNHPMTGKTARFVEEFSDFRAVAGIRRPYKIVTKVDGQPFAETVVDELTINGPVSADDFVRPTG